MKLLWGGSTLNACSSWRRQLERWPQLVVVVLVLVLVVMIVVVTPAQLLVAAAGQQAAAALAASLQISCKAQSLDFLLLIRVQVPPLICHKTCR